MDEHRSHGPALKFQSTHPARGATFSSCQLISIPPISIHAPREGCDLFLLSVDIDSTNFNPRTPRGVRPHHIIDLYLCAFISIHAPREGCDAFLPRSGRPADHFNPRTPRGVRRRRFMGLSSLDQFQSTHPARGATWREGLKSSSPLFQSTHPARGATSLSLWRAGRRRDFNPRTPRGVRRFFCCPRFSQRLISIHAPREGCDFSKLHTRRLMFHFNPRTPRGVRRS